MLRKRLHMYRWTQQHLSHTRHAAQITLALLMPPDLPEMASTEGCRPLFNAGRVSELATWNFMLLRGLETLQVGAHAVHEVQAQQLKALCQLLCQAGNLRT